MSRTGAPDPRKVTEAALTAFVYLPLGLALEMGDLIPRLAERGRNQVLLARRGAGDRAEPRRPGEHAEAASPRVTTPTPPIITDLPAARARTGAATAQEATRRSATPRRTRPTGSPAGSGGVGAASRLAIPGYDTLSASQVIARLDALTPDELTAVEAYEAAHRGRRTILSRVAQLRR